MTARIDFTLIVAHFNQPEEENIYFCLHLTYSYDNIHIYLTYSYDNTPRTPGVFGAKLSGCAFY